MKYKFGQKIFVVTGNKAEFIVYRNKTLKEVANFGKHYRISDIVYVHDPMTLKGCRDVHGVFYGNWKKHPNIIEIIHQIIICNSASTVNLSDCIRNFYLENIK